MQSKHNDACILPVYLVKQQTNNIDVLPVSALQLRLFRKRLLRADVSEEGVAVRASYRTSEGNQDGGPRRCYAGREAAPFAPGSGLKSCIGRARASEERTEKCSHQETQRGEWELLVSRLRGVRGP